MKKPVSLLLVLGIVIAANLFVQPFLLRLDFTKGKQYTLHPSTRDILKNLDGQVTVTAYFSEGLPPDIGKVKRDFQDLLVEYAAASKGRLDFKFVNPENDEQKQEAAQLGIQPLTINVREKDQVKQQQAFLGAAIRLAGATEVIPFVQPGVSMEYNLSSAIKKLSISNKPTVAFLQGYGEPSLNELSVVVQEIARLYQVLPLDLNANSVIPDTIKAAVWLAPKMPVAPEHFATLEAYLYNGGQLIIGLNRVEVNMQSADATSLDTGLEHWLRSKGIEVDTALVVDAQCGSVTVPQYLGMIQVNTQVKFPYLPMVNSFADHPVTQGLDGVLFPYVSPVRFLGGTAPKVQFTPLVFSSTQSGIQNTPLKLQIQDKQWTKADFPLSNIVLGGVLSGPLAGGKPTRMIVFGDGDFPVSGQQGRAMTPDNTNLLVNSVDWLCDDSGLMGLRTRTAKSRPMKAEYLLEESQGKRQMLKWGNMLLPVALTIIGGIFFHQRNARIRRRRMAENYE